VCPVIAHVACHDLWFLAHKGGTDAFVLAAPSVTNIVASCRRIRGFLRFISFLRFLRFLRFVRFVRC